MNITTKYSTPEQLVLSPQPEVLISMRSNNYSLLGIRDHKTESAITKENQRIKTNFKTPLLYTLVSQNRKISINKTLSTYHRVFLNFESFRWSELYFSFFNEFTHSGTKDWLFKNLMYSMDSKLGHYQFICRGISSQNKDAYVESPIDRSQNMSLLMEWIMGHEHSEALFLIHFYDLILIATDQKQRALCSQFVSTSEAQIIINYFFTKNVLAFNNSQVQFAPEKLRPTLRDYFNHKGKLLFTKSNSIPMTEFHFTEIRKLFSQKQNAIDGRYFETSFYHR